MYITLNLHNFDHLHHHHHHHHHFEIYFILEILSFYEGYMSLVFFNEALNQDLVSMDMVSINMDVKFQVINMVNAKLVLNMDYVLNMDWVHNMHVFKVLNMDVKKVINMVVIYLP